MKKVRELVKNIRIANAINESIRRNGFNRRSLSVIALGAFVATSICPAVVSHAAVEYQEKVVLDLSSKIKVFKDMNEALSSSQEITPSNNSDLFGHLAWNDSYYVKWFKLPFDGNFRYHKTEEVNKYQYTIRGFQVVKVVELYSNGNHVGYRVYTNVFQKDAFGNDYLGTTDGLTPQEYFVSSPDDAFNTIKTQLTSLGVYETVKPPTEPTKPEEKPSVPEEKPSVPPVTESFESKRLGGIERIETSIKIAQEGLNGEKMDNVILSYYLDFPDSLSASSLVSKYNAPIILCQNSGPSSKQTIDFVQNNLKSGGQVIIVGGEGVIDNSVIQELKNRGITNVKRLGGADRYATNGEIIKYSNPSKGTPVIIANSYSFADALSVSPISSYKNYPIIISQNEMDQKTKDLIASIAPSQVYIVGGNGVISTSTENYLKSKYNVKRLGGLDRYATSEAIFNEFYDANVNKSLMISYSMNFADALSGSYLGFKTKSPMLLVDSNNYKNYDDSLTGKSFNKLYVLGGSGVVSDVVANHFKK